MDWRCEVRADHFTDERGLANDAEQDHRNLMNDHIPYC